MSERGAISPEWDEIVGERGAELSGAVCCEFERWSRGSEHPCERGAEILTAQLCSHALAYTEHRQLHSKGRGAVILVKFHKQTKKSVRPTRNSCEPVEKSFLTLNYRLHEIS